MTGYVTQYSCPNGGKAMAHPGRVAFGTQSGQFGYYTDTPDLPDKDVIGCYGLGVVPATTGTSDFNNGVFVFTKTSKPPFMFLKSFITPKTYLKSSEDEYYQLSIGAPNLTSSITIRTQISISAGGLGSLNPFGTIPIILVDSTAGLAVGDRIFISGIIGPCVVTSVASTQLSVTFDTVVNSNLMGTLTNPVILPAGQQITAAFLKRHFDTSYENLMFQWYSEQGDWTTPSLANSDLADIILGMAYYDGEMPDPYENLGVLRTLYVPPPPSGVAWSDARHQGCDNGCFGNYLLYNCYNRQNQSCDSYNEAIAGATLYCDGTWNVCEPSLSDLIRYFSYTIPNLTPIDVVRQPGNTPSGYSGLVGNDKFTDVNATRWSIIYSISGDLSGLLTNANANILNMFPNWTQQRIRNQHYSAISQEAVAISRTGCPAGYGIYSLNAFEFCEMCPAGTWSPGGFVHTCYPCPDGTYCPHGSDTNTRTCQAGYYCYTPASQVACPLGFFCPAGSKEPISCDTDSRVPGAQTTTTTRVIPAQLTTKTSIVVPLNPGITFEEGAVAGLNGILGPLQYVSSLVSGDTTFDIVSPQYWSSDIPAGRNFVYQTRAHYCPPLSSAPLKCSPGFYCPTSSQQINCTAGHFCRNSSDSTYGVFTPKACPVGTYYTPPVTTNALAQYLGQTNTDGSTCYSCPGGLETTELQDGCKCPSGLVWSVYMAQCIPKCPRGQAVDYSSPTNCSPCPPGTYAPIEGLPNCIQCPNNFNSVAIDDTNTPATNGGATSCRCGTTRADGVVLQNGTTEFNLQWNRCAVVCNSGYTAFWSNCVPNTINASPKGWPGCNPPGTFEVTGRPNVCISCPYGVPYNQAGGYYDSTRNVCNILPAVTQACNQSNPAMSYNTSDGKSGAGGSDRRLKTNIKRTGGYIGTLPEYTWDWNEKAHEIGWSHYPTRGVMAQEALEVYPDAVFMAPNGYYMVNYNLIQI